MDKMLSGLALHAGALLARLTLGQAFLVHGWSKLSQLATVQQQFAAMDLPAPQAVAVAVGLAELVGGALLLLGWWTRAAAAALAGVMVGALILAHPGQVGSALMTPWPAPGGGLVAIPAWMHLLPLLFLAGWGPGAISVSGAGGLFKGGGGAKPGKDDGGKKKDKK